MSSHISDLHFTGGFLEISVRPPQYAARLYEDVQAHVVHVHQIAREEVRAVDRTRWLESEDPLPVILHACRSWVDLICDLRIALHQHGWRVLDTARRGIGEQ